MCLRSRASANRSRKSKTSIGSAASVPTALSRVPSNCHSVSIPTRSRRASTTASWKSNCNGWRRIGRRRSKSALRDPSGRSAIMAQEVRTVEQQTPATRESTREAGQRTPPRPVFMPPADIYETKDSIVVLAEMPGVSPEGVDISLERRVLTIRGRSAANEHSGYQRVYNEYADGDYERVFTLSENIDRARIEAPLKDGVLQLVLPKAEAAKARKIELKASPDYALSSAIKAWYKTGTY